MFAELERSLMVNPFGIDDNTHISYAIPIVKNNKVVFGYFLYKQIGQTIEKPYMFITRDSITNELVSAIRTSQMGEVNDIKHVEDVILKSQYVNSPSKEREIENIKNTLLNKSFCTVITDDEFNELQKYAEYVLEMELENLHPYYKLFGKMFFYVYG